MERLKKQQSLLISFLELFAAFTRISLSLRYKVRIKGIEHIKNGTPTLILPNHQALVDPMLILSHIYKDSHAIPLVSSSFYDVPGLKSGFKTIGAIRVSNLEAGSRNINVLNDITQAVLEGFERDTSVILYPSGQLASQGYERIINKKSAQKIVSEMPDGVKVIGIRTSGLWGSMFSKAQTGKTPNFFLQIIKGVFFILANLLFFLPRRKVSIEIEDITQESKENAQDGIKGFNLFLEEFFNVKGEEQASYLKHFFFLGSRKQI